MDAKTAAPTWWSRLRIEPGEGPALAWAFLSFFSLMSGYYLLRPVREALISADMQGLSRQVFTTVFGVMLLLVPAYGALVSRYPRRKFLPFVYAFTICALIGFSLWSRTDGSSFAKALSFSVFLSVLNLFLDSVFWSYMADIFTNSQARRLYGIIAAGGTIGAISGPAFTALFAREVGTANLMLLSAAMFGVCVTAIVRLMPWARAQESRHGRGETEEAMGGSILAGAKLVFSRPLLLSMVLIMACGVSIGTLLYQMQGKTVGALIPDENARTQFFGQIDLAVNVLVLLVQISLTRFLMTRYGIGPTLLIPAAMMFVGVVLLSFDPSPLLITVVQVFTRGSTFALIKPARESVFTRVDRESRYKAKNFIDTVVYRGGDMASNNLFWWLTGLGIGMGGVALAWIPMALVWLTAVLWLLHLVRRLPPESEEVPRDPST